MTDSANPFVTAQRRLGVALGLAEPFSAAEAADAAERLRGVIERVRKVYCGVGYCEHSDYNGWEMPRRDRPCRCLYCELSRILDQPAS